LRYKQFYEVATSNRHMVITVVKGLIPLGQLPCSFLEPLYFKLSRECYWCEKAILFNINFCHWTIWTGDIGYLSGLIGTCGIKFRHTVASYNYSWHTAPTRQFIVNLDGAVEVEVSSGEKKVIGAGEVFFVEDTSGVNYEW